MFWEAWVDLSGSLSPLVEAIESDFKDRLPGYHKSRREGLSTLAGIVLETRSANLMELAASLPRPIGSKDHRYQYISRLLGNRKIDCDEVMAAYAGEIFERLARSGQTIVLMLDQSKLNDVNQVLMLSLQMGERALPVAWRVRRTQGNIGFAAQQDLLNAVRDGLPLDAAVMLTADRFYGTAMLIKWCQEAGWGYRIRLKGNLTLKHAGGELCTGEAVRLAPGGLEGAELYGSGVVTNIGLLHEKGHPEPWIIAMDARPNPYTTFDYGLRWGIEPMFSDLKSRGFGITQSRIKRPDRLERLILIMATAMYWAVSCGAVDAQKTAKSAEKRGAENNEGPFALSSSKACASCADVSPASQPFPNFGTSG